MTNLSWNINGAILEETFDIKSVRVMNDFEAIGYGIDELEKSDLLPLNSCSKKYCNIFSVTLKFDIFLRSPTGPIALLGPGTGLGVSLIFY
jgi:glucokinase